MEHPIKYIARFKIETLTPLSIGQGDKGISLDKLVAKDANHLPYIPGTSIAGIIKHEIAERSSYSERVRCIFGFQNEEGNDGQGSRIVVSAAHLLSPTQEEVLEGIQIIDFKEPFFASIKQLPERDHVRINHRGTAVEHGKYEEELVRKGCRFVFEIELSGTGEDKPVWEYIIDLVHHDTFRIGAGTRKGLGAIKAIQTMRKEYDLRERDSLKAYLNKGSSLNTPFADWETSISKDPTEIENHWVHYQLSLKPDNFFLFGAGVGEIDESGKERVDNSPKTEYYFDWKDGKATLSEEQLLIPATSIKGAIAHRVAFHYNALMSNTIGEKSLPNYDKPFNAEEEVDRLFDLDSFIAADDAERQEMEASLSQLTIRDMKAWKYYLDVLDSEAEGKLIPKHTGEENEAVRALFGFAKEEDTGARGKVIFSDAYIKRDRKKEKVFNHVAIDRFTGGGIDGALFQEKVVGTKEYISLDIFVKKAVLKENEKIKNAFERTLKDIATGHLALGGNTTKGHGIFHEKIEI